MIETMSDTASIFTPKDETLEERVRAYKSVSKAFRNVRVAQQNMPDPNQGRPPVHKEERVEHHNKRPVENNPIKNTRNDTKGNVRKNL